MLAPRRLAKRSRCGDVNPRKPRISGDRWRPLNHYTFRGILISLHVARVHSPQSAAAPRWRGTALLLCLVATTATAPVIAQPLNDTGQINCYSDRKSNGLNGMLDGQPVVYTIEVGNAGPSDVDGAVRADTLPAELINALWSCTPVQLATCTNATGSGDISELLDLAANAILRFELSADVSASSGSVNNTASVVTPAGTVECVPTDNSATDSDPLVPEMLFRIRTHPPCLSSVWCCR